MEHLDKLPSFPLFFILLVVGALFTAFMVIATSFLKIVVVLHITKSALGLQEVPPNMAINALALILTIYIMAPVGIQMSENFSQYNIDLNNLRDKRIFPAAMKSSEPLREFLITHSSSRERLFFMDTAKKMWPQKQAEELTERHLLVAIPAFTATQLKSAFEVGFLIYLPFIVIDMIVSNILLALGMMMVSPMTISAPFKLLLFVLVDGWSRLLHGLILSYN
ncbi:MAG: type III secretion protein R [Lentisphaeria bacterium]|jgi:type III secretion protein R